MLDALGDLATIWLPEFLGEGITQLVIRGGRGRWQRVAMGNRRHTERAVRFLRRNHISAWVRLAGDHTYEVVVRTPHADIARGMLNAPGSSGPA